MISAKWIGVPALLFVTVSAISYYFSTEEVKEAKQEIYFYALFSFTVMDIKDLYLLLNY